MKNDSNTPSSRALQNLIAFAILSAAAYYLAVKFNAFETLYAFSRQHEALELDEFFTLLMVLSVAFAIFSLRRILKLRREIETRKVEALQQWNNPELGQVPPAEFIPVAEDCGAIVEPAHSLDIHVVAKGVENQHQLDFLNKIGCDAIQGYLFSHPVEAKEISPQLQAFDAGNENQR